jgi:NADPH2:quinone reductase
MVHFGVASGQIDPLETRVLTTKGSLFLTRPTLANHVSDPVELGIRARDLFSWIGAGKLELRVEREFPLSEVADAHRAIEARATSGKLLLHI